MSNCRNCGAPHNGIECEYCGTIYKVRLPEWVTEEREVRIVPVYKEEKPLSKWKIALIVLLCAVCWPVVILMLQKRQERLKKGYL